MQFPVGTPVAGGMNVAPGTTAVLTSVDAVGGMDVGPGVIPLKSDGSGLAATCGVDGKRSEKTRPVPSVTPVVSSARTLEAGTDYPLVVPSREHLDNVRRLMAGDEYIGRGCRQRELPRSRFCNPFKVSELGRELAINLFEQHLDTSDELLRDLRSLSGKRLLCHCSKSQRCHADALIRELSSKCPGAYDRRNSLRPPTFAELNLLAMHREEPQSEEGSSADEGTPSKGSGWCGLGETMYVGVGYTCREHCDGQGLASPGRWPVASRYPDTDRWQNVVSSYVSFAEQHGTTELLMSLALGRVRECPLKPADVQALENEMIMKLESMGVNLMHEELK